MKLDPNETIEKLNAIYAKIPDTEGCMKHIGLSKEDGGCGGWCCKYQSPQALYSEFLNSWRTVLRTWTEEKIVTLVERSIRNYLSAFTAKRCIFWEEETMLCGQHETRPYSCRIYGITPEQEFKPRYERLKILYQTDPTAIIRDQCNLIKPVGETPVTIHETMNWWVELVKVEMLTGVEKDDIHDGAGGSYRTFHDHILLHLFNDTMMRQLETLRMEGTTVEREIAIQGIVGGFRSKLRKLMEKADGDGKAD
ncbi:MAG: YkgJ family cysteine cluster protein [Candidatus Competibacteraceae bacterium]|nr:YkgJ family cysteine cluster protein [Candidatus Competibacteraceae bacterium]